MTVPRPIRREVPRGCTPGSSPLPWPSPRRTGLGSPFPHPQVGTLTTRQTSLHAADRAVAPPQGLLTLRFAAGRFPPTTAACYRAPWRLPGPDSHRLATTRLQLRQVTSSHPLPASGRTPEFRGTSVAPR